MSVKIDGFKSSDLLEDINKQLESDSGFKKEAIKSVGSVVALVIKNKEGKQQTWLVDLKKDGSISAVDDAKAKGADAQIITSDLNLKKLINGKTSAQTLFLSGRLKLKGNMAKAINVESVFTKGRPKTKL